MRFLSTQPQAVSPPVSQQANNQQRERTQKVFDAIKSNVDNNTATPFRAGDISQTLRDGGFPLGSWEVRGELSVLADIKLIELNAVAADWRLTDIGAGVSKLSDLE